VEREDGLHSGGQQIPQVQEWLVTNPLHRHDEERGNRPAASAVNKASEAFYKLRGVRTIDVHIVTCAPRKAMQTWRQLESALLDVFRNRYFQLPRYNKVRPAARQGLFSTKALDKIISQFDRA
jgi:hypothetical protein